MRFIGAGSLLGVGAVHLQQYLGANFRTVPTIGSLFLLNVIGCAVVGFTLLMLIERVAIGPTHALRRRCAGDGGTGSSGADARLPSPG